MEELGEGGLMGGNGVGGDVNEVLSRLVVEYVSVGGRAGEGIGGLVRGMGGEESGVRWEKKGMEGEGEVDKDL